MNGTNISYTILERLADELTELTPEARKAATYVLENPRDVGVSTVREIAEAANVKPNTVVRMARQFGFEGYEDFRAPFRDLAGENRDITSIVDPPIDPAPPITSTRLQRIWSLSTSQF